LGIGTLQSVSREEPSQQLGSPNCYRVKHLPLADCLSPRAELAIALGSDRFELALTARACY
jgi:hypothetical protein